MFLNWDPDPLGRGMSWLCVGGWRQLVVIVDGHVCYFILPSGKLTWLWKITIFNGKIHYKWPFSIAMLNYQRVYISLHPADASLGRQKSCDHVAAALHERKHCHMSWIMVQSSHHRVLVEADCEVLCPLLEIFEPLVLHLEINPLFPPPVVAWLISTSKVAKEIHGSWGVRKCGHVFCVFPAENHGIWWICNYLGVWFIFMKRCLFTCREPQVAKQPLQFCIVLPEATLVCWLPFKFLALACLSHTMHLSTPYRSFDWWVWWCLTFDVWSALSSWGCQGDGMS